MLNSFAHPSLTGRLAMTRSIGDYDLKPFGVTAVPDTKEVSLRSMKCAKIVALSSNWIPVELKFYQLDMIQLYVTG